MSKDILSRLEVTELVINYRNIEEVLEKLAGIEGELVKEEIIEEIRAIYKQLKAELQSRGYSEEEIADMS